MNPFKKHLGAISLVAMTLFHTGCAAKLSPHVAMSPMRFLSGSLTQQATVYCPSHESMNAPSPQPWVVMLHGGFWGDDSATHSLGRVCTVGRGHPQTLKRRLSSRSGLKYSRYSCA